MIEQSVREFYQALLVDRIAKRFMHRISPNTITWISGFLGILVIPSLIFQHIMLAVFFLLLSGYCDTLDGTLARLLNQSSAWGSALDISMDRCVEFSVIMGLWLVNPTERALGSLLMLGSILLCITSFLVVGIFSQNTSEKSFYYSPGLIERAEAFIFFIVMMLWSSAFLILSLLFSALVTITAIVRLKQFYQHHHPITPRVEQPPKM